MRNRCRRRYLSSRHRRDARSAAPGPRARRRRVVDTAFDSPHADSTLELRFPALDARATPTHLNEEAQDPDRRRRPLDHRRVERHPVRRGLRDRGGARRTEGARRLAERHVRRGARRPDDAEARRPRAAQGDAGARRRDRVHHRHGPGDGGFRRAGDAPGRVRLHREAAQRREAEPAQGADPEGARQVQRPAEDQGARVDDRGAHALRRADRPVGVDALGLPHHRRGRAVDRRAC